MGEAPRAEFGRRTPLPFGLLAVLTLAFAVLVGLGAWQWQRRGEKALYLAGLAQALGREARDVPVSAPGGAGLPDGFSAFDKVRVSGLARPELAVPVRATLPAPRNAKSLGGLGFWWFVPVETAGGFVFVNLGFVPVGPGGKPPALALPGGVVAIEGLLRLPETRGAFLPPDEPDKREFFLRDPAVMARASGLAGAAPFFVDALRQGDGAQAPVGLDPAETIARVPNDHLSYALTWWGLAATLLVVGGTFLRKVMREDGQPAAQRTTPEPPA